MSWSIGVVKNDLKVSKECFEKLNAWAEDNDQCLYHNSGDGTIGFDHDAMEHMSAPLYDDDFLGILKEYKVNGSVCFSSVEGDDAGENWGFQFTDGELKQLKGRLVWE